MSTKYSILSILAIAIASIFVLSSCEEVPPEIVFEAPLVDSVFVSNSIPAAQTKHVIIEEFSGVRCVNCPAGNAYIKQISDENPGRIISAVLHTGGFAVPYPDSTEDFESEETKNVGSFLQVVGFPSATVDRALFDGQTDIPMLAAPLTNWGVAADERMTLVPPVNVTVSGTYNASDRSVRVRLEMVYTEAVAGDNNFTIYLIENKIIDPQLDLDGYVANYEHNHVVRKFLTASQGTSVTSQELVSGLTAIKEFEVVLEENWVPENMEVVAFVHRTGDSKEILQGAHGGINN